MRGWILELGLAVGVLGLAAVLLRGETVASYAPVDGQATDWMDTSYVDSQGLGIDPGALYHVSGGRLFLRVRLTTPHVFLVTQVSPDQWSAERIAEFRRGHLELETFWPSPASDNAGVRWAASAK